jgi:hypothetical protein
MGAGCAMNSSSKNLPPAQDLRSLELFVSRASIALTEYEQFKIINNNLVKECGKIDRGRYIPAYQALAVLTPEQIQSINPIAWKIFNNVRSNRPEFDEPGDNDAFYDPGQYYLTLEYPAGKEKINTSLDSTRGSGNSTMTAMLTLAEKVRGAAGVPLCGNREFYQVGARK